MSFQNEPTDEDLMKAYVIHGDSAAFANLYKRYEQKLFGYFSRRLAGSQNSLASDLFQRTWLKVHEGRKSFDSSRKFSSWFFTIAQNLLRDHLGSVYVKTTQFLEDEKTERASEENIENGFYVKQEWEKVQRALLEIPACQKEAFLLSEWEGCSTKEIAEVMNITEANARQLVSRARSKLRTLLMGESRDV